MPVIQSYLLSSFTCLKNTQKAEYSGRILEKRKYMIFHPPDDPLIQEEYRLRPQFRKCSKCNVMFGSNEQLAVHISTAHRNTQTWNCMAHQTCPMVRNLFLLLVLRT